MKYSKLNCGLEISALTLGTMMFGNKVDSANADIILGIALENGINSVDTAGTYNFGESELIIGRIISGKRDKIILGTKIGYPLSGGIDKSELRPQQVISETEAALKRLNTDYIDILYLHAPDHETPIEQTLEAADKLVKSGKVRFLGVSNYSAWELTELLWTAEKNHFTPISVTQNIYNGISRIIESELVPCAKHFGFGVLTYNPLAGGLLTGKYSDMSPESGRLSWNKLYKNRFLNENNLAAVNELKSAAEQNGMKLTELALRWCLTRDFTDSVLIGVTSPEQLENNLKMCSFEPLSQEITDCCEKQWSILRGTSPGYAR